MKAFIFLSCVFLYALCVVAFPSSTQPTISRKPHLLGKKECTWGPSYWCGNITSAKSCNAVKHCIQTVWVHQTLPEDNDSVCQICINMVKQARDQLQSNETQEELKEVFEGSCNLIPLKIIAKECDNLVDQFIPELVDTLASQMNPQVVCSVAGLCNNARIDRLLAEEAAKNPSTAVAPKEDQCEGCHTVMKKVEERFHSMSRDQVLQGILRVCGRMSSLSDSCTNIVLTYFNEIYSHLQDNLNPDQVCLMAGVCSAQFHVHEPEVANVEITPLSDAGRVNVAVKDDLPCDLCEQLVKHLRDLLVANTTEAEFQRVLQGLCSQTKSFKGECLSLVNEYYPQIYQFLVSELNPNSVCVMVGICHSSEDSDDGPMWALLPPETAEKSIKILSGSQPLIGKDESASYKPKTVQIIQTGIEVQVSNPELVQLPIERMLPHSLTLNGNTQLCTFCEYFLHFLQEEITSPKTERKIKMAVDKACEKLPKSVSQQCVSFVELYGDAFVAILAQEIDPSQVCPLLSLCPAAGVQEVEILMHSKPEDKPNCPLCLFAVTQLEDMIKNEKTEATIRNALNKLCTHLPKNLVAECEDFVHTYANELVEMLIADLSPQEVCVYMKLCDDKSPKHKHTPALVHQAQTDNGDWTLDNEIPDNTIEGKVAVPPKSTSVKDFKDNSPQCIICEFIMSQIEKELQNKSNEDEIKKIVHGICNHLPKSVGKECNDFVNKYADVIIQLLIGTMEPSEVCGMMDMCHDSTIQVTGKYRGAAHNSCNLNYKNLDYIPVFFHNFSGYDSHLLVRELELDSETIQLIPTNKEKYISFSKIVDGMKLRFLDSYRFLSSSLEKLVSYTTKFPLLSKHYPNIVKKTLLTRKGIFPYDYVNCWNRLEENVLPPKKEFYSKLNNNHISDEDYAHAQIIWRTFEHETLGDYLELYLETDVLLLADVFENFRDVCLKAYALDPVHYYTTPEEILDCAICETTVTALDKLLDNPNVDHKMEHVLKKACLALPSKNQEKCKAMIDAYGDSFFHMVSKLSDAKAVCHKVGLCSSASAATVKVTRRSRDVLVGSNKCTWGPSYWCKSKEAAEECKATKHCEERNWQV